MFFTCYGREMIAFDTTLTRECYTGRPSSFARWPLTVLHWNRVKDPLQPAAHQAGYESICYQVFDLWDFFFFLLVKLSLSQEKQFKYLSHHHNAKSVWAA